MNVALKMPGVRVDRVSFLQKSLAPYGARGQAFLMADHGEWLSEDIIDHLATGVIKNHTNKVTLISTAAGIPGGIALLGTIPADLAQFYWHFLVMAQKLAYLYGWPDLRDENNELGDGAQAVLTLFVGVALGVNGANALIREIAEKAARQYVKRIPQMALTKTFWYPIVKKVAYYIGIKLTKDGVGRAAGKIIPILGGLISGGLSYATFKPMAKKLKKELSSSNVRFQKEQLLG